LDSGNASLAVAAWRQEFTESGSGGWGERKVAVMTSLRAIERLLAHRPQEGAEALNNVLESADTALRHARHMIWDMRAVELDGHDLAGALEIAARSAMAGSALDLVFAVQGNPRRARPRNYYLRRAADPRHGGRLQCSDG
jgi:signal transduction histidine kinase